MLAHLRDLSQGDLADSNLTTHGPIGFNTEQSDQEKASIDRIRAAFSHGTVIPYLGPGMLAADASVPASPEALATLMTEKVAVPHKIRKRLTAAAQFIENFKHRRTLVDLMNRAFTSDVEIQSLHRWIVAHSHIPLIVDAWYDNAIQLALSYRSDWGQVQGLSQAEHFGHWFGWYSHDGLKADEQHAKSWHTLLYKPFGSRFPQSNYLVSDSDFVEVLTEIDIQTPIPTEVQLRRKDRHFLFLGCRFDDQLQRTFARQIMKRSSKQHWAVISGTLSRNERRFIEEQNITQVDLSLPQFTNYLTR